MWELLDMPLMNESAEWILVLEDDAVGHLDFRAQLMCALRDASLKHVEALFLDARTDFTAKLANEYLNTVAVAYRPEAALRAAHALRRHCRGTDNEYDQVLHRLCISGILECGTRPLVSESGAPSMMNRDE
jgi:hypothetical protein